MTIDKTGFNKYCFRRQFEQGDTVADKDQESTFIISKEDIARMTGRFHSQRRILITGELNSKSLKKASLELVKLDLYNNEPITILLESGGGDVVATQQLEDIFRSINSPVDVIVMGDCCSMAIDLVLMCRKRMILPAARMLVHYIRHGQKWICDDAARLEQDLAFFRERIKEIRERRLELYRRRTSLSTERIEELFRHGEVHEAYFSATQALELKLVDEIISEFKFFPKKEGEK